MPNSRWERVQALFGAALYLPAVERAAFIDAEAADTPDVVAEVRELLAADEDAEQWEQNLLGETEPERLGIYKIEGKLGEGGMGVVYLAQREDEDLPVRVAIKVLRAGWSQDDQHRRFLAEQRILARLEHPNIARIMDAGSSLDGRPYFVMEYVDGQPITTYCREHSLSVSERLDLFRKVCDAVHFAHQNLVIHRDLKPGNVLVDASGRPRLLDFGIAKILCEDGDMGPATSPTMPCGFTVEYASPEQLSGDVVTTASDVYALGILLYEVLTDEVFVPRKGGIAGHLQLLERGPTAPSSVLRSTNMARSRAVRGDLDTICLTSLNLDPQLRYQSALALSTDVHHHQLLLPIAARAKSTWYRACRLVRRNQAVTGVLVSSLLVLSAMVVSLVLQRAQLIQERDQSEAVKIFVVDLFKGADRSRWTNTNTTLDVIVDRGRDRIEDDLADQPEAREELLYVLAKVYVGLARYESAQAMLEEVVVLRRARLGENSPELADTLTWLGFLYCRSGDVRRANICIETAVDVLERVHGHTHKSVALVYNTLGSCFAMRGALTVAKAPLQEAYQIRRDVLTAPHILLAQSLLNLGIIEHMQDRVLTARAYLEATLEMRRELGVRANEITALIHLGRTLAELGEPGLAVWRLEEAVTTSVELLRDENTLTAEARVELGLARFQLAGEGWSQAQAGLASLRYRGHGERTERLRALEVVSSMALERGLLQQADELLREAHFLLVSTNYLDEDLRARLRLRMALVQVRRGEFELARGLLNSDATAEDGRKDTILRGLVEAQLARISGHLGQCEAEVSAIENIIALGPGDGSQFPPVGHCAMQVGQISKNSANVSTF